MGTQGSWLVAVTLAGALALGCTRQVTSPSGEVVVTRHRLDLLEGRSTRCDLSRGGERRWSREIPFLVLDLVVNDEGYVFGHGYSRAAGERGFDAFFTMSVNPSGQVIRMNRMELQPSTFLHERPIDPHVTDLVAVDEADCVIARMSTSTPNEPSEDWWLFWHSSGQRRSSFQPRAALRDIDGLGLMRAARVVPGTPLVLAHWTVSQNDPLRLGAVFALLDLEGRLVWKLELPEDYGERLDWLGALETGRAIVSLQRRSFEIVHARSREAVSYRLRREGKRWLVDESGRRSVDLEALWRD